MTLHDQAYAKSAENCTTVSHNKKHEKVKENYVYIATTSSNDTNPNCKFFNPSDYCQQVLDSDIELVGKLIILYHEKLSKLEQTELKIQRILKLMFTNVLLRLYLIYKLVLHLIYPKPKQFFFFKRKFLVFKVN